MTTPTVEKYLACSEFDPNTGACIAQVWVDAPGVLPYLSIETGGAFAMMIGIAWLCVAAFGPIEDAARDN